jgi:protein SCO1/2
MMYKALPFSVLCAVLFNLPVVASEHSHHDHSRHQQHNHQDETANGWLSAPQDHKILDARFALVNGQNQAVTEQNYHGQYLLISFGFSNCAHVCPTILRDWAMAVKQLPATKLAQLQPIMITLDPERDSPAHMDHYSKGFHPKFHGLSGSLAQIDQAAKNFRVTYHKVPVGENDYQINHSSLSYLVDPQGKVIDYFGFGMPSDELAKKIAQQIP